MFEERKKKILDKLKIDIKYRETYLNGLSHKFFNEKNMALYKKSIGKYEMELIQLIELHRKIGNITEDI